MFDITSRDQQGTDVSPLAPEQFDLQAYAAYAAVQDEKVSAFAQKSSGVLVYRRFRVPEVYSYGSRDKKLSLALQLSALQKSMDYPADFANFLEPWYGIGAAASAFGAAYIWPENQSPATVPLYSSLREALSAEIKPIAETSIGRATLDYIDYFLDKTKGLVPISMGDIQSPINAASGLIPISDLFLEMLDEPALYQQFAGRLAALTTEFLLCQQQLLGKALARPGHGFASSRALAGIGISDDNSIMISNPQFEETELPLRTLMGKPFGGVAFHSCGNWEKKIASVLKIGGLLCADGAFTSGTDPDPNTPALFGEAFCNTGVTLHARMVGSPDELCETTRRLWRPGLKLIVCTYCQTPEEQADVYTRIHEICKE